MFFWKLFLPIYSARNRKHNCVVTMNPMYSDFLLSILFCPMSNVESKFQSGWIYKLCSAGHIKGYWILQIRYFWTCGILKTNLAILENHFLRTLPNQITKIKALLHVRKNILFGLLISSNFVQFEHSILRNNKANKYKTFRLF